LTVLWSEEPNGKGVVMSFKVVEVGKERSYFKGGMKGFSNGGKTVSAVLLGYGMTGDMSKVCVIDTENRSTGIAFSEVKRLSSTDVPFKVINFQPPFTPERYIEAIDAAIAAVGEDGFVCLDSMSHEWMGEGGILEAVEIRQASQKNKYTAWGEPTKRHNRFVSKILQSPVDMMCLRRAKHEYVQEGKSMVKVGTQDITRGGFEFELSIDFNMLGEGLAEINKNRSSLFKDQSTFRITPATGRLIREWLRKGKDPIKEASDKSAIYEKKFRSIMAEEELKQETVEYIEKLLAAEHPDTIAGWERRAEDLEMKYESLVKKIQESKE
jgi:hypothetical protein